MIKRFILTALVALTVLAGIFGYKFHTMNKAKAAAAARKPAPAAVTAAEAVPEIWQNSLTAVGTIESVQGVTVRSEIEGRIFRIGFESGATVKAGDILVELDTSTEDAQLKAARARAHLAEISLQRERELHEKQTNTQANLDVAEAASAEALAAIEGIEATLAKKRIRAPFAGRLAIRQVNHGQFINKGDVIVGLEALDPVYVDFGLPQQDIAEVKTGLDVAVTVDAFPAKTFAGKIEAVSPRVSAETRNLRVRAAVPNPGEVLRPGMFCRAEVKLPDEQKVLVLPGTCVVASPYGDSVYVVVEEKPEGAASPMLVAKQRFVKVGARRGDQVAILSGVKQGERVVTSGQVKLRNNAPVQINNTVVPSNNPAPKPAES